MGDFGRKPFTANAPMYVDFEKGTPNVSVDDYFDKIHPELFTPGYDTLDFYESTSNEVSNIPEKNLKDACSKNTFIDEIDEISMTPVKIVSPKTKGNDPVVEKTTTINDVWGNVNGILASIPKHHSKFGNMNSSMVSLPTNPTPRKIRVSRSMHKNAMLGKPTTNQPEIKSSMENAQQNVNSQKTCNSMVKNTRRSVMTPKVNKIDVTLTADDEFEFIGSKKGGEVKAKNNRSILTTKSIEKEISVDQENLIKSKDVSQKLEEAPGKNSVAKISTEEIKSENSPLIDDISEQLKATSISKMGLEINHENQNISLISDNESHDDGECYQNYNDFEHFEVHESCFNEQPNIKNRAKGTVLTSYARRRSSIMAIRRRSNKYIPIAEAVKKFQQATPKRFRSSKPLPKQVQKMKYEPKSTIPISPALQCKNRSRRPTVLSRAEREEMEIQEMRKHQIHANRLRTSILAAAKPLKDVPKKGVTIPKPFQLTKVNQKVPIAKVSHDKSLIKKNTVPTVVSAKHGISMQETEILYFGVPICSNGKGTVKNDRHENKKKIVSALPPSFEARNKQFLDRKEQKLKQLLSEEEKKNKAEFHARPVPSGVIKKAPKKTVVDNANFKAQDICNTKPAPFSFEERNKILAKRKEANLNKLKQEETKTRVFHANPAPTFKPVMVRGRSRENISKPDEKNVIREKSANTLRPDVKAPAKSVSVENLRPKMTVPLRGKSVENLQSMGRGNSKGILKNQGKSAVGQENKAPNRQIASRATSVNMPILKPKLKALPFELHSDKRAKLRKDYDEHLKQKMERDEMNRKREQAERLLREQMEIAALRKNTEIKARPMPAFKPLVVLKSSKPLTEPGSPAWTRAKR